MIIIIIGNKNKFNNSREIAIAPQVKIASFVRIFTVIKFHFFIIFWQGNEESLFNFTLLQLLLHLGNRTLEGISSNETETNPH